MATNTGVSTRSDRSASQPKPISISIPSKAKTAASDADEESGSDEDGFDQDYAESIGVSIGKEQSRLMSPMTPAAEKSAALDFSNSWGFFDGEEAQAEVLRNTLQNTVISDPGYTIMDQSDALIDAPLAISTPRVLPPTPTEPKSQGEQHTTVGRQTGRPRASTTNALGDSGIKKFFTTLTFPQIPEPWTPRQRSSLSSGSPRKDSDFSQKRHSRSNSLLPVRWAWPLQSLSGSQSRDQSPKRRTPLITAKRPAPQWDGPSQTIPNAKAQNLSGAGAVLRRSASDDSLLRPRLSRHTTVETIGDDISKWEHINSQVNSRSKAIRDSLQDSIPNMPNISFSSLRPDIALRSLRESNSPFTRSMSTIFGNDSITAEPAKTRTPSPSKLVRTKWPSLNAALDILEGDIIVLGGYRGSILRSTQTNRQLWVPVKVGLGMRKVDLEVGLDPEDELNMEQRIFASGMLANIGPVDVSKRLLKKLRQSKNAQDGKLRVHEYAYDWRLSPALLSQKLIAFMETLRCNAPSTPRSKKGAVVLAHSLGGLITRHAVNQRPNLFAAVTSVGTPQHCVNILGPLRNGDEVLLSSKVLTAQVNFTFRTSFLLLPENGQCFIDKYTKEEYMVDFFNVESWKQYAFSPCIAPCLPALGTNEWKSIIGTLSNSLPSLVQSNSSSSNMKSLASSQQSLPSAEAAVAKLDSVLHPQEGTIGMSMQAPLLASGSSIPVPAATAYLKRTLAEILQFKKEMQHNEDLEANNLYPPHAIMYSTSAPTVYGARVAGRDAIKHADAFDDLAFASGDGVVLARAAMMPPGYKVVPGGRVRTERGHVGMMGDLEAVGKCLLAVLRARAKGVGQPEDIPAEQSVVAAAADAVEAAAAA